ncbi:MAG: hypothetical protein ACXAEX_17845, partial [Promethearchaeota archaeon]
VPDIVYCTMWIPRSICTFCGNHLGYSPCAAGGIPLFVKYVRIRSRAVVIRIIVPYHVYVPDIVY